jgi:hypothetical protein
MQSLICRPERLEPEVWPEPVGKKIARIIPENVAIELQMRKGGEDSQHEQTAYTCSPLLFAYAYIVIATICPWRSTTSTNGAPSSRSAPSQRRASFSWKAWSARELTRTKGIHA